MIFGLGVVGLGVAGLGLLIKESRKELLLESLNTEPAMSIKRAKRRKMFIILRKEQQPEETDS